MGASSKWTSGRLLLALMRHYDWRANTLFPEVYIDGSQADLLLITASGYATEFEIKVSLSDWNADQKKRHWKMSRPSISRFFYVVPEHLVAKEPPWVPQRLGIISVSSPADKLGHDILRVVREAKRVRCLKVEQQVIGRIYRAAYYRFWHHHFNDMYHRLYAKREREKACQITPENS